MMLSNVFCFGGDVRVFLYFCLNACQLGNVSLMILVFVAMFMNSKTARRMIPCRSAAFSNSLPLLYDQT